MGNIKVKGEKSWATGTTSASPAGPTSTRRNRAIPGRFSQRFPHLPAEFQSGIDAVVVWSSEAAYFFKGEKYARVAIATETMDATYPKNVSAGFPTWRRSEIAEASPGRAQASDRRTTRRACRHWP